VRIKGIFDNWSFLKSRRVWVFSLSGAIILFSLIFILRSRKENSVSLPSQTQNTTRPLQLAKSYKPAKNERIVYPYSIIPGGVLNREELTYSTNNDKIVAAHFSDFRVNDAKVIQSNETKFTYVSYRIKNKVFWTSKKLRIPKGETLITDGRKTARTRCGNILSEVPRQPVFDPEPDAETFNIPVLARLDTPETGLEMTESTSFQIPETSLEMAEIPAIEPFIPIQRPRMLPSYYRPLFVLRRPSSIVPVPEPATLGLLMIGLASLVVIRKYQKK